MKVLVVYQLNSKTDRNTINEHLFSFRKYGESASFHYFNVYNRIPAFLKYIHYDAVILHYTYLAGERYFEDAGPWIEKTKGLEKIKGYKVALPQDEYDFTDRICNLFKKIGLKAIYTCFTKKEDIEKAYPFSQTGVVDIFPTFTGYVDEEAVLQLKNSTRPYKNRPIDIGYRARKLSAFLGKHGQLKYELVEVFSEALKHTDLEYDISSTNQHKTGETRSLVKLGNEWYDFVLNCKAFIGCEGGSSLLDRDGSIQKVVKKFEAEHPDATFAEIERACFPGMDHNISCFAISPRHFEAALCKTLQILVEGEYGGALKPWEHYIPLKQDFSNIGEVLEILKDTDRCQDIVDRAYQDVVLSGKNTYRNFVNNLLGNIRLKADSDRKAGIIFRLIGMLLDYRNEHYLDYLAFRKKTKQVLSKIYHLPVKLFYMGGRFVKYRLLRFPRPDNN